MSELRKGTMITVARLPCKRMSVPFPRRCPTNTLASDRCHAIGTQIGIVEWSFAGGRCGITSFVSRDTDSGESNVAHPRPDAEKPRGIP
jgi:hypothetical protein